jgi:parallel beta-helix repeat protein
MPEIKRYKQYEILQRPDGSQWELGAGAMGTTYKAFDTNLERAVALKIINSAFLGSDIARQQFLREARSAAGLRHPNIASVYDLGTDQDQYFYVMELIDGITAREKVERDGPFGTREALTAILQISSALAAAERQQLVHRDLKPANLMLTEEHGERVVKIIDFGLAKKIRPSGEVSGAFTIAGGFVGTAEFASPEQIRESDLDVRADIYSLGATLFYLLAGSPPFTGAAGEVLSYHLYKAVPLDRIANQPAPVVELVRRMMEKEREKRPQNAAELRQLIEACLRQLPGETAHPVSSATAHPSTAGPDRYKLLVTKEETSEGQWFRGTDESNGQSVDIFVFNRDVLADQSFLTTLRTQAERVSNGPHPLLRTIYSFQETSDRTFLVEETELGLSLQEVLRARQQLDASEVAALITRLADLADHAQQHDLGLVDLTLRGIRLGGSLHSVDPGFGSHSVYRLDSPERPEMKADPIDLSLIASSAGASVDAATWQGGVTLVNVASTTGPRSSYLRLLSLLGYELLGGQRDQVELFGRISPLPAINEEANLVLRKGMVDEFGSAAEMAADFKQALAGVATARSTTHPGAFTSPQPARNISRGSTAPLIDRPSPGGQSTTPPPVIPPPLPPAAFSAHGSMTGPLIGSPVRPAAATVGPKAKPPLWKRPVIWIFGILLLVVCCGVIACIFTVQQLIKIADEKYRQQHQQITKNDSETEKQKTNPPASPSATAKIQGLSVNSLNVPDQYPKIQAAIDAAKPGDTVLVRAGVYQEKLKFKEGIILQGEGRDKTIVRYLASPTALEDQSSYDAPLEVRNCKSGRVEAIGFEQTGADDRTYNDTIRKIDGIMIIDSSITVRNCRAQSAAYCGIGVYGAGSAPTLEENECRSSVGAGIFFFGARGVVNQNVCEQNHNGISVGGVGAVPVLTNNQCRANKEHGFYLFGGARCRIEQNVCETNDDSGIAVFGSGSNPDLINNRCQLNKHYGIYFGNGAGGTAERNVCAENEIGGLCALDANTNPRLLKNQARSNKTHGMYFGKGAHGVAEQNVCEKNDQCGIAVFDPLTAPELTKNQCQLNKFHGIFFSFGAPGRAIENVCDSNADSGIAIRGANPFLSGNTLTKNSHYGLVYDKPSKPTFGAKDQASQNVLGQVLTNAVFK